MGLCFKKLVLKLPSNLKKLFYLIKSLTSHAYVECSNVHVKAVCVCVMLRFSHLSVK